VRPAIPQRLFEITPLDALRVAAILHGRDLLLFGLMGLGLLVVWRYRARWERLLPFYAYFLLIVGIFGGLVVAAIATGTGYERFLLVPLTLSPFFAGPLLWWLDKRLWAGKPLGRWLVRLLASGFVLVATGILIIDFFRYQPLVPRAQAITPDASSEYVLWLHSVNSGYQRRMLSFAETHTEAQTRFAVDIAGQRQFMRYFGLQTAARRGLYLPLQWREPVDPSKVNLFLLHWPGLAGGLSEQVEFRSAAKLTELRNTPGWGLVYDNGESFILWVR
jgi:hypothetical protein